MTLTTGDRRTRTDAPVTARYLGRALAGLGVTTCAYMTMNGAGLFETAVLVPAWSEEPPASLALLRGEHAPDLQTFWIVVHTLHELSFVAAIVLCWRLRSVRKALLALFAAHVAVRVWTVAYFAPTIMEFWTDAVDADPGLGERVARWQDLNLVRVVLFFALSLALLPLVRRVARRRYAAAG